MQYRCINSRGVELIGSYEFAVTEYNGVELDTKTGLNLNTKDETKKEINEPIFGKFFYF